MNELGLRPKVNSRTKATSLSPGAAERSPTVIQFLKRNEPFELTPGEYQKVSGW